MQEQRRGADEHGDDPVKRSRQDRDGHVELRIPSTGVYDWKGRCDSALDSDTLEAPTIDDHVGDSQEQQTIIAHEKCARTEGGPPATVD